MKVAAAALQLGDDGPSLHKLMWDGEHWSTHDLNFNTDEEALEAWDALGLEGWIYASRGRFYVGQIPAAVSVTLDAGAGQIYMVLDQEQPQVSGIGFVENSSWILENGVGFLEQVVNTPGFTMKPLVQHVN
jgi:hypothetical protein